MQPNEQGTQAEEGGESKQVSLSQCPLLSVTLKGRAVVIKWHVITPPWGARESHKAIHECQVLGTLAPAPWQCLLAGHGTGGRFQKLVLHLRQRSLLVFLNHGSDEVGFTKSTH